MVSEDPVNEATQPVVEQAAAAPAALASGVAEAPAEAVAHDEAGPAPALSPETAQAFEAARERLQTLEIVAFPQGQADPLAPFAPAAALFDRPAQRHYGTAAEGIAAFNARLVAAWRENTEAAIEHWQKVASVSSLSEAIALNAEHVRSRLETVNAQTRELSGLATQMFGDIAKSSAPQ